MTKAARLCAGLILGLAMALPAAAQQSEAVFDLYLKGLRAATLSVSGGIEGTSYAASGRIQSAGLVGLLRSMRYDARTQGSFASGRFNPSTYSEDADTGSRQSQARITWKGGVPQVTSYSPPRSERDRSRDVDASTQGGTIDPLTAIFAGLRETPLAEVCSFDRNMFDGRRQSRVTLSSKATQGETITCQGRYQRIAGFSQREMAEKTDFRFTLTYVPSRPGMMHVSEVTMDTVYGKARLVRR